MLGIVSTRGRPAALSSPAMASLTASVAPARRSAARFRRRSPIMYGIAPQASRSGCTRPRTQRVMGRTPQAGQSAPRLMRVDQKQTGQWSRTVTATRSGASPESAPSADSECCAWTIASESRRCVAKARGTESRLRPPTERRVTRSPSRSSAPGLVVTTDTSWPASRSPSARARDDQPAPPARGG